MIKQIIDLRIGDDLVLDVAVTDEITGDVTPMDDWGLSASMSCDSCCTSIDLAFEWINQSGGTGLLTLDKSQTAGLESGDYSLQIRTVSPTGRTQSPKPTIIRVRE